MTREPEPTATSDLHRWPTFLRLDRSELDGDVMVVPARPSVSRARTRTSATAPFAYLFDHDNAYEPEAELRMTAGRFDPVEQTWIFSGQITGLIGITEPTTS
ncbi:hypothetical protein [Actinomadura flavalba]|uniref:hypothetical protein n=1 Tax=Actinomadura flavalba TaxID=1120938 RepID=UPI000382869D|nr:hypothetical protein [Actinomadura flavalba]